RAVREDQLHSVGAHARERIGPQLLLHQRRKPVHPFAEVHGFRRHQHPDRSGRDQHSATHAFERRTARNTASTSRGLAPPGTLTLIVPITISMQPGRRSWVASFTCADFTDTTGTKVGNDPTFLLIGPPSAADRARYLRAALNDLSVVTNVDHNVHTILYPKRIAIVHHSPSLSYVG